MRNGLTADTLRRGGCPHRIIFGLNLPQIAEIAAERGKDQGMARRLWQNDSTRESQLMAPMIWPVEELDYATAKELVAESRSTEVVDVLCHRLLRHADFALQLAVELADSERELDRYGAMRLLWHFLTKEPAKIREIATREIERPRSITTLPARQIIDELDFIEE